MERRGTRCDDEDARRLRDFHHLQPSRRPATSCEGKPVRRQLRNNHSGCSSSRHRLVSNIRHEPSARCSTESREEPTRENIVFDPPPPLSSAGCDRHYLICICICNLYVRTLAWEWHKRARDSACTRRMTTRAIGGSVCRVSDPRVRAAMDRGESASVLLDTRHSRPLCQVLQANSSDRITRAKVAGVVRGMVCVVCALKKSKTPNHLSSQSQEQLTLATRTGRVESNLFEIRRRRAKYSHRIFMANA